MIGALKHDEGDVPVWASYTDVAMNVTVVLLFYLFTQATISTLTGAELIRIHEEQQKLKTGVVNTLPEHLRSAISVVEDGQLLRYRFADRVLFDSGAATLKESGKEILALIGEAFRSHANSFSSIQVEGHTDDIPIRTPAFASNWELSSARATSVVRFLEDSGLDSKLLSATGYSQYHPVPDGDESGRGKERNRRIEIVVVYTFLNSAAAK